MVLRLPAVLPVTLTYQTPALPSHDRPHVHPPARARAFARRSASAMLATALLAAGGAVQVQAQSQGRTTGQAHGQVPRPTKPATLPRGVEMKLPATARIPDTFEELFAYRDARATAALGYLRCMESTIAALRAGTLGAVPRGASVTCVQQGEEWRGVFGELTDSAPGIRVQAQYALRGEGMLVRDAIDTARVSGTARALLRGLSTPLAQSRAAEFVPVPLPQNGYVEVWLVPLPGSPARVTVGGDSLIQMSGDGVRELGHSRTTSALRQFAIEPASGSYTLRSSEERVPLLSELLVARMALGVVAEVHVRTYQYDSVITRTSPGWTHTRR